MRKLFWLILFLLFVTGGIALYNWTNQPVDIQEEEKLPEGTEETQEQDQNLTQVLLDQDRAEEALAVIRRYDRFVTHTTPEGRRWMSLLIDASEKTNNGVQLMILYSYFPQAFEKKEDAIIVLARHMIATGRIDEYDDLRKDWKGKEKLDDEWFLLDADALSYHGEHRDAVELLKSRKLEGKKDAQRLVRLALESIQREPQAAWDYLNEAISVDPENPSVRLYRARFLEAIGKKPHALSEYITLVQLNPQSLMFRDQLADFFIRNAEYDQAVNVLKGTLINPTADFMWLKTYFWSKVTDPIAFDWNKHLVPDGPLTHLLDYLATLPEGRYWDDQAFEKVVNGKRYLKNEQATLWFRLIQRLMDGEEKQANDLLRFNPFTQFSYNPELEKALRHILKFRIEETLTLDENLRHVVKGKEGEEEIEPWQTTLFADIAEAAKRPPEEISTSLRSLLESEEVFAGAFLAAGWNNAAVSLHQLDVYPDTFPVWMPLRMARAIFQVRGADEALAFLAEQRSTPQIDLLTAELLLTQRRIDEVLTILQPLTAVKGEVGKRATWLTSNILLEKGEDKKAEQILKRRGDLLNDTLGQEILGRIALKRNEIMQAERIYEKIRNTSSEAKSYFARKAFAKEDYDLAHELTVELLQQYPNNLVLRQNLQMIMKKQEENQ